jgi:hypothetical protein
MAHYHYQKKKEPSFENLSEKVIYTGQQGAE